LEPVFRKSPGKRVRIPHGTPDHIIARGDSLPETGNDPSGDEDEFSPRMRFFRKKHPE
jgi:hypothetical protein